MNLKAIILYLGSIAISNINDVLAMFGFIANIIYILYQLHTQHKKNKE